MGHALLIPLPAQGHINPMMQLAWKLVSDGFIVTFLNTDFNHPRMIQANTVFEGDRIRMISIPNGLSVEDKQNNVPKLLQVLENSMAPSVIHKLIQDINDGEEEEDEHNNKVTSIIADVWTCFGLQEVAKVHQIPLSAFHTSLVSNCVVRYFGPRLVSLRILSPDGSPKEDKKIKYLPSLPPMCSGYLPRMYSGEYIFQKSICMGEEIKQIKWVLSNSFYELEAAAVEELSEEVGVYPIGPLNPSEFMELDARKITKVLPSFWANKMECLQWLDRQSVKSVIYVSFGILDVWSERKVEDFVAGMEASGSPFLWVVRSDLMDGSEAVLPPGFLERVGNRGFLVSWAPQLRVLSHSFVACFVTHCGWNYVQESIAMGVSMLCSPYIADQFLNRSYIVDVWKSGLALESNSEGDII